jgi:HSP20 family protein
MNILVRKVAGDLDAMPLFEELQEDLRKIRQNAFRLFQERGAADGWDLDDWLRAEREVVWIPAAEMLEKDDQFILRVAVPGLDSKQIELTVTPGAISVRAAAWHHHDEKQGRILLCDFCDAKLCRRIDLPAKIDLEKVTAKLDKGILEVVAAKAAPTQTKKTVSIAA